MTPLWWVLGLVAVLALGSAVALFLAGEDLFGSDPGTIDSYNREVLESCELPAGSVLVQTSVRPVVDQHGELHRSMWFVYASPSPADNVAEFFGVTTSQSMLVPSERACRFGQRPSVLVLPSSVAGEPTSSITESGRTAAEPYDGLWADEVAELEMNAEVPPGTESLFRLRVAQREIEGKF